MALKEKREEGLFINSASTLNESLQAKSVKSLPPYGLEKHMEK